MTISYHMGVAKWLPGRKVSIRCLNSGTVNVVLNVCSLRVLWLCHLTYRQAHCALHFVQGRPV